MKKAAATLMIGFVLPFFLLPQYSGVAQEKPPVSARKANINDNRFEYRIGRGDVLEIITWKEPDFSRNEVIVRLDGKISFPLIDDIQAAERTPTQLKKDIETRLQEFLASPNVTVSIRNAGSQKFYILGEVTNTGEYPLSKELTVLQALALAGGFTEWASKKEIILFRKTDGKEQVIRINYRKIIKDNDFSQNIELKLDDTIIVP